MKVLRIAVLTVAGGPPTAVVLYLATAPSFAYTCPIGDGRIGYDFVCEGGYADAWTGAFPPFTQSHTDISTGQRVTKVWGPNGYENIRVIPLPVGFVAGSLLTLAVIAVVRMASQDAANSAA